MDVCACAKATSNRRTAIFKLFLRRHGNGERKVQILAKVIMDEVSFSRELYEPVNAVLNYFA
jgi:hypothetical protein